MPPQDAKLHPAKALLLTGAGFSRPFGGYLASEMWALIFRQPGVRNSDRLRKKMLREMNFERVYEEVMTAAGYTEEERHGLTEAIWRAYRQMHTEMCIHKNETAAFQVVREFISRFVAQDGGKRGFVFTLNQDLLVEKFRNPDQPIVLPGVTTHEVAASLVTLPDAAGLEKVLQEGWPNGKGVLTYIKLHGSFDWQRHDGSRALVIGTNKGKLLSGEPLLKWYQEVFRNVLHEPGRSLLVVGYSFRDTHINDTILSAVRNAGLRLFVMSPDTPERFRESISEREKHRKNHQIGHEGPGDQIWESLYGYYCGSVEQYYDTRAGGLLPQGEALFEDLGLQIRR